jgi:hypothetical protein
MADQCGNDLGLAGRADGFSTLRAQHTVQVKCGTDQRKMRKCLREIAECLALPSSLLGIEPEMVGIAQHALEQQPGLVQPFRNRLTGGRPLMDGLPGEEGTFNMCSFWLVEALTNIFSFGVAG